MYRTMLVAAGPFHAGLRAVIIAIVCRRLLFNSKKNRNGFEMFICFYIFVHEHCH